MQREKVSLALVLDLRLPLRHVSTEQNPHRSAPRHFERELRILPDVELIVPWSLACRWPVRMSHGLVLEQVGIPVEVHAVEVVLHRLEVDPEDAHPVQLPSDVWLILEQASQFLRPVCAVVDAVAASPWSRGPRILQLEKPPALAFPNLQDSALLFQGRDLARRHGDEAITVAVGADQPLPDAIGGLLLRELLHPADTGDPRLGSHAAPQLLVRILLHHVHRLRNPAREGVQVHAGVAPGEIVPAVDFHVRFLQDAHPQLVRDAAPRAQETAPAIHGEPIVHFDPPGHSVDPELAQILAAGVVDGQMRSRILRVDDPRDQLLPEAPLKGRGDAQRRNEAAIADDVLHNVVGGDRLDHDRGSRPAGSVYKRFFRRNDSRFSSSAQGKKSRPFTKDDLRRTSISDGASRPALGRRPRPPLPPLPPPWGALPPLPPAAVGDLLPSLGFPVGVREVGLLPVDFCSVPLWLRGLAGFALPGVIAGPARVPEGGVRRAAAGLVPACAAGLVESACLAEPPDAGAAFLSLAFSSAHGAASITALLPVAPQPPCRPSNTLMRSKACSTSRWMATVSRPPLPWRCSASSSFSMISTASLYSMSAS
eukprot:scaffold259_cov252-Pinguiococcus_pyrenoidosus.AAC.47